MKDFIGIVKDKVSLSKLAFISKPNTLSLHLAVLRTTSHAPSSPPNDHHLATLLSLGDSSRATASVLIHSLMNRLHRTADSYVALKCLFTIHHIIKRGPFILKDQLPAFPAGGGRNNLKLSGFRDGSSATTWVLSAWVRWYASEDSISSYTNHDLIRDFESLVSLIEEICEAPDNLLVERDRLLHVITDMLMNDYLSTVNEILLRLSEFKERVSLLSFNDSVELISSLDRLLNCKEKLSHLFSIRKTSVETLWELIEELNNKIGMVHLQKLGKRPSGSESARFDDRTVRTSDSMKFSSGRLNLNWSNV
ncbi:putative clathrin assembly protein [Tanacetum coccineum]